METKDYQNELTKHDKCFNKTFPMLETLQHTDYNLYLEDPLGEGQLERALDLFCFKPLEDQFHVPQDSDAYDEKKILQTLSILHLCQALHPTG